MKTCIVEGCNGTYQAKGYCKIHYLRVYQNGSPYRAPKVERKCSVEGCDNKHRARGYCSIHYDRVIQGNGTIHCTMRKPGEGRINDSGYITHGSNGLKDKREHRLIAERVMGKPLPEGAVVHHVNGIRDDNRNENLVVCENGAYHQLIHRRQRAFDACGNANFMKCHFCKEYDDPKNMYVHGRHASHKHCAKEYERLRKLKVAATTTVASPTGLFGQTQTA